ncbi:MAG: invasion associated locus B family protein [Robiginitomaculum sp.]
MKFSHAFILCLVLIATPVLARADSGAKLEAVFTDWSVYSKSDGTDKICYVLAKPKSKTPKSVKHGDVYFMIANWKSGAAKEQPSLLTGYQLKNTIPPSARIGSAKVPMYSAQNEAFIESGSEEAKLVRSMRKGARMRIDAVSQRGTQTSYEFSLKGITAALKKSKTVCR